MRVFKFFVLIRSPDVRRRLPLQFVPQNTRRVERRDAVKRLRFRNAEAAHPVCMSQLFEVTFECLRSPVRVSATNLTLEFVIETMKLVEPVRDRLAVPAQRQV